MSARQVEALYVADLGIHMTPIIDDHFELGRTSLNCGEEDTYLEMSARRRRTKESQDVDTKLSRSSIRGVE